MNPLTALLSAVAVLVRAVDAVTTNLWSRLGRALREFARGPLQGGLFYALIGITGVVILVEGIARILDRMMGWMERAFVSIALLAMSFLAFNEYLARELRTSLGDAGGLWALEGQMNIALLLMVVVGFLGASLATQERSHIAIDAIDRVLSPGPSRTVKRLVSLVAAGLCLILAQGSWKAVFSHSQDAFEGASVWEPMVAPINAMTSLMPGDKYGPASCRDLDERERAAEACPEVDYGSGNDWIDAQYDRGLDPFEGDFEHIKVAVENPTSQDVTVELVVPGEPEPTRMTFSAPADGAAEFQKIDVEERLKARLEVSQGTVVAGEVVLSPGVLNVITVRPRGPPLVRDEIMAAFGYVETGERFPLWVPLLLLVVAFGTMALRFLAHVFRPVPPGTAASPPIRSGTRSPADVILAGALPGGLVALGLGAWLGQGWLILIASILLVLLGAPLFVAVGVGTLACWAFLRDGSAETVVADMFEATKKQELLAIPFFVLAGNLMTRGSIATRLIEFARALVGGIPGGLGAGAVAACAFFAAISGSSPVTVIAIGSIMFPMLVREGYSARYSMGVLTTAGGLGIIIPPSIPMIVYAIMVSGHPDVGVVDPATLFKAGILPGLFIALVLVSYTFFVHWPRDGRDLELTQPFSSIALDWLVDVAIRGLRGLPSLLLPVLILGGIYGWLDLGFFSIQFTVTEAAAVAVIYALFVELVIHRELKIRQLPSVFSESAIMMGSLFLILVIAISLNRFFVFEQVPEAATAWMLERVDSPLGFLIMVNLFLLALGCVMDILSAILIVAPLLAPIAASYGIHPVHFGIMFIVNLELGYLTPPLGINLFVASTVFNRSILEVIRAVVPFLLLMLFCLVVIVWVPSLSLFLVEP